MWLAARPRSDQKTLFAINTSTWPHYRPTHSGRGSKHACIERECEVMISRCFSWRERQLFRVKNISSTKNSRSESLENCDEHACYLFLSPEILRYFMVTIPTKFIKYEKIEPRIQI
jgi:hypothetical protein